MRLEGHHPLKLLKEAETSGDLPENREMDLRYSTRHSSAAAQSAKRFPPSHIRPFVAVNKLRETVWVD